jgi:hypothetical protein
MNALLKWWIQVSVIVFGVGLMYHYDWWNMLWEADLTKLSFFILFLFVCSTLAVGYLSSKNVWEVTYDNVENYVEFTAETMTRIGMIGTVIGFLIMLGSAFQTLDVSNIKEVQESIQNMAVGMSTALVTTLVGLVCSTLTQVQLIIYNNSIQDS